MAAAWLMVLSFSSSRRPDRCRLDLALLIQPLRPAQTLPTRPKPSQPTSRRHLLLVLILPRTRRGLVCVRLGGLRGAGLPQRHRRRVARMQGLDRAPAGRHQHVQVPMLSSRCSTMLTTLGPNFSQK